MDNGGIRANPRVGEACQPCLVTHLGVATLSSNLWQEELAGTVPACLAMAVESLAFF